MSREASPESIDLCCFKLTLRMDNNLIHNVLSQTAFHIVNKNIARIFNSNDAAVLLSDLVTKDLYFKNNTKKYKGWFFNKAVNIEKDTVCNSYTQRKWFKIFKELQIIQMKLKGTPPKQHFKINYFMLEALLRLNCLNFKELNVEILKNQLFKIYRHINKNKLNKIKLEDTSVSSLSHSKSKYVTPNNFDEFWKLYPLRKNNTKSKALAAWLKICKLPINGANKESNRPKWKTVKKAIISHSKSERWTKQPHFIPLTTTWLNQFRWNDSASELTIVENYNEGTRTSGYRRKDGHKYKEHDITI